MMKKVFAVITLILCIIGMSMLNKTYTRSGGFGGGHSPSSGGLRRNNHAIAHSATADGYYGHRANYYGNDMDFVEPIIVDATVGAIAVSSDNDDDNGYDDTDYTEDESDSQ